MNNQPKLIDTSKVTLPNDLMDLIERLAENNHHVWVKQRFAEGWTYGYRREEKKNPDLVPYSELPESEKIYDRNTVIEALKAIIALGYKIEKM